MSTYEPGTVAVATVRGVPNVRVIRTLSDEDEAWFCPSYQPSETRNGWWPDDDEVTDVRPLIVLDLGGWRPERVAQIPAWLREKAHDAPSGSAVHHIADQIEAQTKPPKPTEPTGLGAVVEAEDGRRWIRIDDDPELNKPWRRADFSASRSHWMLVDAVRVLSEGVES